MARGGGGRRRTYVRDANGRFASTPGGGLGAARKAARSTSGAKGTLAARSSLKASRAKLRAKDPADQRLSTALSTRAQKGAVTRGNKALRAAKAASQRTAAGRSGVSTIPKKRSPVMKTTVLGGGKKVPAIDRPGSMANTLRQTMQALAKADARRIREIESITGQKVRAPRKAPAGEGATVRASGRRSVSGTLGDNLKKLAQSDARMMRGIGEIVRDATPKVSGRKGGKAIGGGKKALPPASSKPPAPKPPTRAKGSRISLSRTSTTIKKQKGLKPQIKLDLIDKKTRDYKAAVAKTWNNPDRKLNRAYIRFKGVEADAYRKVKNRQGDTSKVAKTINTMRKAGAFFAKHGAPTTFNNRPIFSTNPGKAKPPTRAKGSRTRLPGMGGTIAKPKGLKPGALAERRAAKAQKPINTNPTRKPRKSKYQLQIVDQANRILDKLKLRMVTNAKGFNRYNLEDRIAKVNKIAKTAIPGYRHNPMRKNSSAKSAYQERNRRYGKAATAARNIARGSEFFRYGKYID